jgi:hypothetical protein
MVAETVTSPVADVDTRAVATRRSYLKLPEATER